MKSIKSNQRKFSNGVPKKTRIKRIIKDLKNEHEIQVRSRGSSLFAIPSGYVARQNKTIKVNIVKPINVSNRDRDKVDHLNLSSKSVTSRSTKEFLKSLEKPYYSHIEDECLGYKVFQEIDEGIYQNQLIKNKRKSSNWRDKECQNEDTNLRRFFRNFPSGKANPQKNHSFSTSYRPKVSHFSVEITDEDDYSSAKSNVSKCNRWLRECSKSEIKENRRKKFATKMVRVNNQDKQADQWRENQRKKFASKMVRISDREEQVNHWSQTSDSDELDTEFSDYHIIADCSNSRSARVRSGILKNNGSSKKSTRNNQSKVRSLKCEPKSKTFTRKWSNKFQSCSILPSIDESKEKRRFDESIPATNYSAVQSRESPASSILNFKRPSLYDNAINVKPKIPGYSETKKRYTSTVLPKNTFTSNRNELNSDSDGSKLKITPGYLASIMKNSKTTRKEINTSESDMSGLLSDEEPGKKLSRIMMQRRRTMRTLEDCKNQKLYRESSKNDAKIETIKRLSKDNSFLSCNQREGQRNVKNSFQLEMEEINKKLELTMSSDVFKGVKFNSQIFKLLESENQKNMDKSGFSSPKFNSFLPEIPVLSVLTPIPEDAPLYDIEYRNMREINYESTGSSNPENEFTGIELKHKETKVSAMKANEKRVQSPSKSFETDRITTNDGMPAFLFNKAGFPLTDSRGRCLKNNLGVKMLPVSSLKEIIDKKLQVYDAFNYPPTTISFDPAKQATPEKQHDIRIFDKAYKPRVLYNSLGYPLSDKDGLLLRDNLGNYLAVLDNEGIPMCCANGEPIYMEDGKLWITEKESYDVLHCANDVNSTRQNNEKRSVTINSEVKSVVYDTKRNSRNLGPETSEKVNLDKCALNYYKSLPNNFVPRAKPKIIEEVRKRAVKKKERKTEKNRNKTATSTEDTQRSSIKVFKKFPRGKKLSSNFKKFLSLKKNFLNITSALPNINLSEDSTFLSDLEDFTDTNVKKLTMNKQKYSPKIEKTDNFINRNESANVWKESNSYVLNLFSQKAKDEKFSNIPKKQSYITKNDEKIRIKDLNKDKLFSEKNSKDVDLAYVNRLKRAREDLNNAFDKLVKRKIPKETYYESDRENEWTKLVHENTEKYNVDF